MLKKPLFTSGFMLVAAAFMLAAPMTTSAAQRQPSTAQFASSTDRDDRQAETLREEIRHQLVTLPYYTVFDWLQADVKPDGSVTLMGEVTRPTTKDDAGNRVKRLENVK